MQYRKFGNTDLLVSEIGFGAWAIGGGAMIGDTAIGWGAADDDQSRLALHHAVETGINFFDTADIYGLGHSEILLGETVGRNNDVIIATKVGNVSRNGKFGVDYSREHIFQACEQSLRRLKRDSIDYYQLHSARLAHLDNGECLEAMETLKLQGKIRYWGISLNTFDPFPEASFFIKQKTGSGFQLVLNLLNQTALPLIGQAAEAGFGIIARMPLQLGLLTGKFDQQASFPANDHRKTRLPPALISAAETALEPVWDLCKKYGMTKTQLALSFILSYRSVSTIIPGIRTVAQADMNTAGLGSLEPADRDLIAEHARNHFGDILSLLQQLG